MPSIWDDAPPELRQDITDMLRESAGWDREKFGLQESGLNRRAAASEAGATARARISANAQLAAAKLQHKAAMARLERLDIPQMEINRMDVEGRLRIAEMQHRLNEQTLGVDVVRTMAELGSQPEDWIKTGNFARGISQTQVPRFLETLANSEYMAPFTSGVAGAPGANSLSSVLNRLGVNGTAGGAAGTMEGGPDMERINQYLDAVGQNPHQYDFGGLTDDELDMLGGGLASRGFSARSVFDFNKRSRPGQGAFNLA